jgi:hypothetical protein
MAARTTAARRPTRAQLREGLLLLGFLLVLAAAFTTVAVPELSKQPDEGGPTPAAHRQKP